ncbi:GNAT family N-acetyltransferase [Bacteroides sp.]|uniref:GNAT family N-acetyltransferase n=1 Tax=Bacteroides sp. TaxID=29523 RepID=UPI00261009A4|nr:GNAT family N-acetyltransferase [Bacteroides sp.]MDD3037690.1 GNAT family N-acetyltransferase [Bacteroides sp.]
MQTYIETPRLILRDWKEDDISAFAQMNADPQVMEFFLQSLTEEETLAFYRRIQDEFQNSGFGLYALERKKDHAFMGYTGLHQFRFDTDFAPGIEIGWRLAHEYWGHGYAPEAAAACLEYARTHLNIKELYSFTSFPNYRSERVMQKIGMQRLKEFGHPLVPPEHPLYLHILYYIHL